MTSQRQRQSALRADPGADAPAYVDKVASRANLDHLSPLADLADNPRTTFPLTRPANVEAVTLTDALCMFDDSDSPVTGNMSLTFSSTLNRSVLTDVKRFEDVADGGELLAVLAASLRHATAMALYLQHGDCVLRVAVLPRDMAFHCVTNVCGLPLDEIARLRLLRVEPELVIKGPGSGKGITRPSSFYALRPLLWLLAMHGSRTELLPELVGDVKYRLVPGASLQGLPMDEPTAELIRTLSTNSTSLQDLGGSSLVRQVLAQRLLNALYLQSGLLITRVFSPARRKAAR